MNLSLNNKVLSEVLAPQEGTQLLLKKAVLVMAGIAFTVCGGETFGCARFCDDRSGGRYNDR